MHSTILTAIIGSGASGLVSAFVSVFGQHSLSRKRMVLKEIANRERLYSEFIHEAAKLYVDSLDGVVKKPSALIPLYAIISGIRLTSSDKVLQSAKKVADAILDSYNRPAMTIEEMRKAAKDLPSHPMRDFTEACRSEKENLLACL
jgi:hypothetical protein